MLIAVVNLLTCSIWFSLYMQCKFELAWNIIIRQLLSTWLLRRKSHTKGKILIFEKYHNCTWLLYFGNKNFLSEGEGIWQVKRVLNGHKKIGFNENKNENQSSRGWWHKEKNPYSNICLWHKNWKVVCLI